MSVFFHSGSLPEDSPLYVERKKTLDELTELATIRDPKYAIIFGPPLMGKTSLIKRLRHRLQSHIPLHIIYVGEHGENFYSYIAGELLRVSQKPLAISVADVRTGDDFQSLLRALAPSVTTVVVFEQLKRVPPATLKNFADILRNTSEMRSEVGNEAFRRFCFMLTGGIELYQAVGGSAVSPLNGVAKEFYLGDLLREESDTLLHYGFHQEGLPEEIIALLCEKIYAQVHGHPYLTQYLGDELIERWQATSTINDDMITGSIDNLLNDDYRFTAMLDQARQEGLLDTLREIMQMPPKRPFMRGDNKVAQLEAIGFIREEICAGRRVCLIRNFAYARKLARELREVASTLSSPLFRGPAENGSKRHILRPSSMYRSITCVLQLTYEVDRSFRVRVVASRKGESVDERSTLPYTPPQLIAVFKALLPALRKDYKLTEEQIRHLQQLGLWVQENKRLIDDPVRKVGQDLYGALMVGEVGKVFERVLEEGIEQSVPVALQLRFDRDDTELARYPWELLYHPTYDELLLSPRVEIVRHMTYATDQSSPRRRTASPLRVLYIASRPTNLNFLPSTEQDNVQQVLNTLHEEGKLVLTSLTPPTFSQLQAHLLNNAVHVLHFDGHGKFGRLCPKCHAFNFSIFDRCQRKIDDKFCLESLADVDEVGYLSFEDKHREEHAIKSRVLSLLMAGRNIRLAMLSACYSGTVDGHTLFGGTAQALVKQGVMAVVAPQLPISPDGAALFARSFYETLAETNSILVALKRGRQSLLTNHYNEWFVPALYTRIGNHRLIDNLFPLT